jgi:hypothetical protein
MDCTSLTNITIPDSVTTIINNAFSGCTNLTINCNTGTYAATYAAENSIPCVLLDAPKPKPSFEISHRNMVFTTDTLDITITLKNAESGTYQIGVKSTPVPFNGTTTFTIGSGVVFGAQIDVYVTAKGNGATYADKFTYKKLSPKSKVYVYYDNNLTNWENVNCYIYTEPDVPMNAEWPGLPMTETQGNIYYYEVPVEFWNCRVIFNNALTGEQLEKAPETHGYAIEGRTGILKDDTWQYYKAPEPQPFQPDPTPDEPVATPDEPVATPDEPVATPDEPVATPDEPVATPDEPIATPDEPVATPDEPIATPDEPEPTGVLGDVDGDGEVTISDATAIQKHLAKLELLDEAAKQRADADSDGEVAIADATEIQKFLAKLPTNENIGKPMA